MVAVSLENRSAAALSGKLGGENAVLTRHCAHAGGRPGLECGIVVRHAAFARWGTLLQPEQARHWAIGVELVAH